MITVVRAGPTSWIRAKKTRKATTVHSTAGTATEPMVSAESDDGMVAIPAGAYRRAVTTRDAVMTPIAGRSASLRLMISGPVA